VLTLPLATLLDVVAGELIGGSEDVTINGLAVDSRQVEPGSAFVAFTGDRVDGHAFLPEAIARGARALLVTREEDGFRELVATARRSDIALVLVKNPLTAVQDLGAWHRERLACPVIGITGSVGKTTTKDYLRSVLGTRLKVVATTGNRNNELGVPLTLVDAGADTEALVVEMAMRGAGQIARLCEIARPTVGLVTNVGVSHVEILGTQEAIADAKGELVEAIGERGRVFLNGDDGWSDALARRSRAAVTTYGTSETCDVRGADIEVRDGMPAFTLQTGQGSACVTLGVPGRHNVYNALAAAAIGLYLELSLEDVVGGLERATFSGMRMETFVSASRVTVINDAYNANPTSMRAALEALADMPTTGRRIAVLGDMAELGSLAELAHFQMGELVARLPVDILVTVGERARRIAEGARAEGMADALIRPCATSDEASEVLDDVLEAGDVVLVKASRVMGLERVVDGIIQPHV